MEESPFKARLGTTRQSVARLARSRISILQGGKVQHVRCPIPAYLGTSAHILFPRDCAKVDGLLAGRRVRLIHRSAQGRMGSCVSMRLRVSHRPASPRTQGPWGRVARRCGVASPVPRLWHSVVGIRYAATGRADPIRLVRIGESGRQLIGHSRNYQDPIQLVWIGESGLRSGVPADSRDR
jgi:hypothetical protein